MIPAPADHVAAFKNCCLRAGTIDGERRNYFFQGVIFTDGGTAVRLYSWCEHKAFVQIECDPNRLIEFEGWRGC